MPKSALLGWTLAFALALAGQAQAQAPASYAVTYIELKAAAVPAGAEILRGYAAASRKENSNLQFELLEETGRQSRFAILEAWNSRAALDAHYHSRNTSRILNRLAALRAAPDDRRMFEYFSAAAPQNRSGQVYVMTHVDVMPPFADGCAALLKAMRSQSRNDSGNIGYDVLRQEHEPNHFAVAEVWASGADFEAHVVAAHTVAFRQKLLPMIGALYDERLFTEIQ
jgi:quinol monooxygenase YgiN